MDFDLVINNGTLIDGTSRARRLANVGIQNGKIALVETGERLNGRQNLNASGLVLAPGFVDIHSHADWILPLPDHDNILAPLVLQGITTVVTGNCGFSPAPVTGDSIEAVDGISEVLRDRAFPYRWRSFGEFLSVLEEDGLLLNAAFLVGHGTMRSDVMGDRAGDPTPEEMEQLCRLALAALNEGAFGFSAGLAYAPGVFAGNDELLTLLRLVAGEQAVFTVHGRAYTWVSPFYQPMFFGKPHNLRSVCELIGLARQAGVRLELSHQIFVGRNTWRTAKKVLVEIENAADAGLDVAFDAFPYTVGNSTINVIFPKWFLDGFARKVYDPVALRKLKREIDKLQIALGMKFADIRLLVAGDPEIAHLEGLDFGTIAKRLGMTKFEAYMHVARLSHGKARVLLGTYSGDGPREEPLQAALAHPLCSFMTDTILSSHPTHNPASFGTYPRVLGRYSRDLGLFTLEEAVRRMTSLPAERIGLPDVGRVSPGCPADLVLFDPQTVADNTTPERSDTPPTGIHTVIISGEVVAQEGKVLATKRHGRVLKRA